MIQNELIIAVDVAQYRDARSMFVCIIYHKCQSKFNLFKLYCISLVMQGLCLLLNTYINLLWGSGVKSWTKDIRRHEGSPVECVCSLKKKQILQQLNDQNMKIWLSETLLGASTNECDFIYVKTVYLLKVFDDLVPVSFEAVWMQVKIKIKNLNYF